MNDQSSNEIPKPNNKPIISGGPKNLSELGKDNVLSPHETSREKIASRVWQKISIRIRLAQEAEELSKHLNLPVGISAWSCELNGIESTYINRIIILTGTHRHDG